MFAIVGGRNQEQKEANSVGSQADSLVEDRQLVDTKIVDNKCGQSGRHSASRLTTDSVATGITKVAKSPFTLHPHLLRKVVT